ncbi:Peptide MFS transporter [Sulfidibacter corallicola]|uniref:Peptide MFS transporter n=1 Tax=Sulfidibacter corallicola TaxID=2818388 RepID=A0A8A4TH93_SULCO|nr:peptide MFS transporter [Sulfidibacter corallicola]QTD48108.1 peptide MFS transporter [Sulfidibacter corallicola]
MTEVKHSHPRGLYVLFMAEMWERFSYYGMRALLVLYCAKQLFAHMDNPDSEAVAVYGSYTALVYLTPLIGGLIADRILGFRKAVILGGILMSIGHFVMAFEQEQVFYLALAFIIVGNGFFKPNISSIVGRLYDEGDARRDAGFTIFYMGINLGAFLAPLICGYVGEQIGWHYGFGLAGIGMVLGLLQFIYGRKHLKERAEPPDADALKHQVLPGVNKEWAVYIGSFLAVFVFWQLVQLHTFVTYMLGTIAALSVLLVAGYGISKCERIESHRLFVALVLIIFSVPFWAFFEQAGSSMNLFTDEFVNRVMFNFEIPASVFQSVNSLFILLYAIPFSMLWIWLAERDKEPSTPFKFGLGIAQVGLGFVCLWYGATTAKDGGQVAMVWLILGYMFHTTGELCVSPVGLSMVTKLSPQRITGLMMGMWFLFTAFANNLAGIIAKFTTGGEAAEAGSGVMAYGSVFGTVAGLAFGFGFFVLVIAPLLKKGMHGIN